jgi:nucleoside-diphosphate-sugar epimerase
MYYPAIGRPGLLQNGVMPTRVLVTGGGGFIGSHLVRRLLSDGHDVRVVDNFTTGNRVNLSEVWSHFELVEGDIQSYERASAAVRGCEVVLHQAAMPSVPRSVQDPLTSNGANVIGTLNILLAARDHDVRRVVAASSSSVYGAGKELPKHESQTPLPISPYAVAKLAGEGYCRSFGAVYGLETVALRYFNVFGERQDPRSQYAAVVPNFIRAGLLGTRPIVHGDGEQSRDFTYVENVVAANVLAMDADVPSGSVYNIACGERTTLNDLIREIGRQLGRDLDPEHTDSRPGDVRHSLAAIDLARGQLGSEVGISLAEGLERTIAHYAELEAAAPA